MIKKIKRLVQSVPRPRISLAPLTCNPGGEAVPYRGKYTPCTKGNFQVLDLKEFLVRLLCWVPPPYEALMRYFGVAPSCGVLLSTTT